MKHLLAACALVLAPAIGQEVEVGKLNVEFQGIERATVHLFDLTGRIHSETVLERPGSVDIPNSLLEARGAIATFSGRGILPKSRFLESEELAGQVAVNWKPRVEYAGVFLYSALGSSNRDRSTNWSEESYSISDQLGRSLGDFLGIESVIVLDKGHYLTGEIRARESESWEGAMAWTIMKARGLAFPIVLNLGVTPFGAEKYPIHVFPIPAPRDSRGFAFQVSFDAAVKREKERMPELIGLEIELEDRSVESIIAKRREQSSTYEFHCKSDRVKVRKALLDRWDTQGISGGGFRSINLESENADSTLPTVAFIDSAYVRFPEDWGVDVIPGVLYSVRDDVASPSDQSPFFLEGGGATLPIGRYSLACSDSNGTSWRVERVLEVGASE